jgi:hypothetical protein
MKQGTEQINDIIKHKNLKLRQSLQSKTELTIPFSSHPRNMISNSHNLEMIILTIIATTTIALSPPVTDASALYSLLDNLETGDDHSRDKCCESHSSTQLS